MENKVDNELVKPIINGKYFDNPWATWHKASKSDIMRLIFRKNNTNLPSNKKVYKFYILHSNIYLKWKTMYLLARVRSRTNSDCDSDYFGASLLNLNMRCFKTFLVHINQLL